MNTQMHSGILSDTDGDGVDRVRCLVSVPPNSSAPSFGRLLLTLLPPFSTTYASQPSSFAHDISNTPSRHLQRLHDLPLPLLLANLPRPSHRPRDQHGTGLHPFGVGVEPLL